MTTEESFEIFELLRLKIIVGAMNLLLLIGANDQNTALALFGQTDLSRLLLMSTAGLTIFVISFLSRYQ